MQTSREFGKRVSGFLLSPVLRLQCTSARRPQKSSRDPPEIFLDAETSICALKVEALYMIAGEAHADGEFTNALLPIDAYEILRQYWCDIRVIPGDTWAFVLGNGREY